MSSGDSGIRIAEYLLFIFFSGPAGRDIYSFWPGNTGSVALPFLLRLRSDLVYAWMNGWLASVCASRGFCCSDDLIAVCPPPVLSQQKALLWSWFPVCHNTVSICLKHYKEDQVFFLFTVILLLQYPSRYQNACLICVKSIIQVRIIWLLSCAIVLHIQTNLQTARVFLVFQLVDIQLEVSSLLSHPCPGNGNQVYWEDSSLSLSLSFLVCLCAHRLSCLTIAFILWRA